MESVLDDQACVEALLPHLPECFKLLLNFTLRYVISNGKNPFSRVHSALTILPGKMATKAWTTSAD